MTSIGSKELNEIQLQINTLQSKLNTIKEQVEAPQHLFPKPYHGHQYFYLDSDNTVESTVYLKGNSADEKRYALGTCFETRDEAQTFANHMAKSFWFNRKALEFKTEEPTTKYAAAYFETKWVLKRNASKIPTTVYLSEKDVTAFADYLNTNDIKP